MGPEERQRIENLENQAKEFFFYVDNVFVAFPRGLVKRWIRKQEGVRNSQDIILFGIEPAMKIFSAELERWDIFLLMNDPLNSLSPLTSFQISVTNLGEQRKSCTVQLPRHLAKYYVDIYSLLDSYTGETLNVRIELLEKFLIKTKEQFNERVRFILREEVEVADFFSLWSDKINLAVREAAYHKKMDTICDEVDEVVEALAETKQILKSKTIASIRERLERVRAKFGGYCYTPIDVKHFIPHQEKSC